MKKTVLLFTILNVCCNAGFAQSDVIKATQDPQNYKEFFKMSQVRFIENISQTTSVLDKETSRIKQLNNLDDSLLAKGEITDSTSKLYKGKLAEYQKQNDSLIKLGTDLKKQLSSLSTVKRKFRTLINTLPLFCSNIINKGIERNLLLTNVEEELGKSNLGAEKKQLKAILGNADAQQKVEVKKIDNIGDVKGNVLASGRIDSATASGVDNRIAKYLKKIEDNTKEIKLLESRIGTPEDYAANSASIKARVLVIDSVVNKSAAIRQYTFDMIEEGLQKSTKTLFSLAAFFGPGGYAIPTEKSEKARVYFSPVIDSLIQFSNKYAEAPRTATILVNGYADATQISKGSKLYNELGASLQIDEPTKAQLNTRLSALRAEELSKLFTKTIKEKSSNIVAPSKITFENIEVGRGEQLPDASIKNYKANDERRRIVIVYWSVLPNE
jgi:Icc-related predicted phosphoesterase